MTRTTDPIVEERHEQAADKLIGELLTMVDPRLGDKIHARVAAGIAALEAAQEHDVQVGSVARQDNERLLVKVTADAQALADVRTLDDWAARTAPEEWRRRDVRLITVGIGLGWAVHLAAAEGHTFEGATPDEARAKAAAWVRSQK